MPNWCFNSIMIQSEDVEVINTLHQAVLEEKFLSTLMPLPNGEWNYEWCVANWGTKWDIRRPDETLRYKSNDKHVLAFKFETAWSPPTGALEHGRQNLGYSYINEYHEEMLHFVGRTEDGDDTCIDPCDDEGNILPDLPEWAQALAGYAECG